MSFQTTFGTIAEKSVVKCSSVEEFNATKEWLTDNGAIIITAHELKITFIL